MNRQEYHKQYYQEHRDEIIAKVKLWADEHPEEATTRVKAWHEAHPDKCREHVRRYKASHRDILRERDREYMAQRPEQRRKNEHTRRARKMSVGGSFTLEEISQQFDRQENKCYYCGALLIGVPYHIDHKTPISRGGSNDIDNIALACVSCNLQKHTRTDTEYMEYIKQEKGVDYYRRP